MNKRQAKKRRQFIQLYSESNGNAKTWSQFRWYKEYKHRMSHNETMLKEDSYYQYTNDEKGLGLNEIIINEYGEMVCCGNDFIPLTNEQITLLNETKAKQICHFSNI